MYKKTKKDALLEAELDLGRLIETNYGVSAMHTGVFPTGWMRPGGYPNETYPQTQPEMQSSEDVINKRELKFNKYERENNLADCGSNIQNHAFSHKCSAYCIRKRKLSERYDPDVHKNIDDNKVYTNSDGNAMVVIEKEYCRMKFGDLLKYDKSGERNLTRGKPPQIRPSIDFDNNGSPKYVARRNHPRLVQQPYLCMFFGANNDTQILLNNQTGKQLMERYGKDGYERLTCNLIVAKMSCLEPGRSDDMLEKYLTSYTCKGGDSTAEFEKSLKIITDKYCSNDNNSNKSLRSLVRKQMIEITAGTSVRSDQCQYMLAGGPLK